MQTNPDYSYLTPTQQSPQIEDLTKKIRVKTPQLPLLVNPFDSQSSMPSFDQLVDRGIDTRKKTVDYSTPFLEVYKPLSSGDYVSMYEKFIPNIDNQERLAQEQTSWDKISNGLTKFGTKTTNAILGGTAGVVYGIGSAINDGQISSIYDNKFSNWLNDLDTINNYQLPNYYTKQEQEKGLGGQMLTTNFWADKFLGGLSFTAGAIVSEGIWAWATGGASLAQTGARLGTKLGRALKWGAEGAEDTAKVLNGMSKWKSFLKTAPGRMYQSGEISKDLAIGLAKTAELGNLVRFTTTSAGYEASVEALQFKKEAEERFIKSLDGRQPTAEEMSQFKSNLESASNSVFFTNMAIVGSSNLITMGKIFDIKAPFKAGKISEFLEKKAFNVGIDKATGTILKQSGKQKISKGFFDYVAKPALTEGLFEEGLQGVTNKTGNKWMEHTYNSDSSHENLDLTGMWFDSMAEQYGSKEGWVDVGLGMLIGIVGGARNSYLGNAQQEKELEYELAVGKTFDLKTIQGELILPQRLQSMNRVSGFAKEAEEEAKKGNIVKSKLAQSDVLLSYINAELSLGSSVKEVTKEVANSLEAVSPKQWAEAGIENPEDYKKETIAEFERVAKSYEKNKTYWQYMIGKKQVGEQNLPEGLVEQVFGTKLSPNQVIIDSLTWNSVRGENAAKFMSDMQSSLTDELGIENGKTLKTISRLLGTKGNLTKNLNSNRALFNNLVAEREVLIKKIEKLNSAPKETEGQTSQKTELASLASKLLETNTKITEVTSKIDEVAFQLNSAQQNFKVVDETDFKGNLDNDYISGQDLINLDKNVEKFKSTLEYVKSTDQQRGQYLEEMMNEYQQAQEIFMLHQASSKMASEAKLENINTWVGGKFLKKNKPMDLDAMEWFTEVATKYQNSKAKAYNKFKETPTEEEQVVENAVNEVKAKTREEELQDEINITEDESKKQKLQEELSNLKNTPQENLIETYKNKIEKLLNNTYEFLGRDVGSSYLDVLDKKPTAEEIEKYREGDKTLEKKLQNWKLLDTMIDDEYMSIAEMIDIVNQHEVEVSKQETKTELTEQDVEDTWDGVSDVYDDTLLQNTTASVTAKMENNGDIRFSHLNLSTIHEKIGGVITINGEESTLEQLNNLKEEAEVTIDDLSMTLDDKGRISMRYEDYLSNRQRLNMYILNPKSTNWTYKTVSEWNGQETVKIKSNFTENIDANDLYELPVGEKVSFVLYNEDGYNDKMYEKLSKEDFKKKVKIMVVKDGKNISVVKAASKESNENLLLLREQAYKAYVEKTSKVLGSTIVNQVYLGTPEVKMNENGEVIELSISSEAVDNVVKATGFIQNGEITTNITFPEGTLNTSFLNKIAEKNREQKVPFVVIKKGIHLLAYPVNMVKSQDSKLNELKAALQEETTQKQVIAVNDLIDKYRIETDKVFPENLEEKEKELIKAFEEHTTFTSMEDFTSADYDLQNLKNDVLINIDLDNIEKAISDAKVRISLDNADFKINISLDTKNLSKTDIENELSDIAIELNEDYIQNADTKYLYSKGKEVGNIIEDITFTNTFDDTPPTEAKSQLDKIRNMNILRKALSDKMPSDLKAIIGVEKLKTIDNLLKAYDRIQKQTNTKEEEVENGKDSICKE